ncbi:transcriptional regulator [Prosthecochloris sp. GSB1]|uniref:AlbA family DNA-binding domain-containing protein n=1 Tax=Prosthecochloris sp. GSB1 TaxID=281093 RepID=UPI000B8CDF30|nr:ATP-binding protein [Prosthecochloris sp. GSB1]ASQ90179.1 transcriptional regulator [Prosthecochloris sp. GSB1]
MSLTWSRLENVPLLDMIGRGETRHTEFKRLVHSPKKIAKSIVAFANTEGGTILVGVDDDRRITGIHSEKEMLEIVYEAVKLHTEPAVAIETEVVEYKKRLVLMVHVAESAQKPHYHIATERDPETLGEIRVKKVYTREESHNRVATDDRVCLMASSAEPIRLTFGADEKMLLEYLDEHRSITALKFSTLSGIPLQQARRTLVALVRSGTVHLVTEGRQSHYRLAGK